MRIGTTPDGARAFLGWHDAMRGDDCAFGLAADGQLRCLPTVTAYVDDLFADNGCTQLLASANKLGCPSQPAVKYAGTYVQCATGGTRVKVYPVTGEHTGRVFTGSPGNCSETTPIRLMIYRIGAEVPATAFQPVAERLE